MAGSIRRTDVMLAIFEGPHRTELLTTTLRLTQALLDKGARVQIWTCGDATGLTRLSLGDQKPRNFLDLGRDNPSIARVAQDLIRAYPDHLDWYVCRFCADERGMSDQIPQIRKRPPFKYFEHVLAADKAMSLGVC